MTYDSHSMSSPHLAHPDGPGTVSSACAAVVDPLAVLASDVVEAEVELVVRQLLIGYGAVLVLAV